MAALRGGAVSYERGAPSLGAQCGGRQRGRVHTHLATERAKAPLTITGEIHSKSKRELEIHKERAREGESRSLGLGPSLTARAGHPRNRTILGTSHLGCKSLLLYLQ